MAESKETIHQAINTFTKGMDKDTDISLMSKDSYQHAENFRLLTSKGNTSMSLEVIEGNTLITSSIPTGYTVIGHCSIRNTLILFLTNKATPASTGNSMIMKATVADGTLSAFTVIYNDALSIDGTTLNFSTQYPISAIGRYETPTIQKVYWVDGYNIYRYSNIITISSTQSVNKFSILPVFNVTAPIFDSFTSGTLTSGKIQYAYQMYESNGSETLFSIPSSLISLTSSSTTASNNENFKGDDVNINSGKGIKLIVPITANYTKLRVVSIKYDSLNGLPTINIVAEQDIISGTSSIIIYDYGHSYLGSYTYEEFAVLGNYIFTATELEVKNNYIFAANITEQSWDIDYDARAYRFAGYDNPDFSVQNKARLYKSNGTYDTITNTYLISGQPVPNNHDCINPFNNIFNDSDSLQRYRYQSNISTLGGSGPNMSYSFYGADTFVLDNTSVGNAMSTSFTDYSNPILESNSLGYQRDEIYRFGIVFFNSKGQSSTVKWIGDIRFPTIYEYPIFSPIVDASSGNTTGIKANLLGIKFNINNSLAVSLGASSYQIVRCKREASDRTIIAQGLTYPIILNNGATQYVLSPFFENSIGTILGGCTKMNKLLEFISPEVSINKNIVYTQGDRLDDIGKLSYGSSWVNYDNPPKYANPLIGITSNSFTFKFRGLLPSTTVRYQINKSFYAEETSDVWTYTPVDIEDTYSFGNVIAEEFTTAVVHVPWRAASSSKLLIKTNSDFNQPIYQTTTKISGVNATLYENRICNYRRLASQYSGNTYSARQNNTYIACSNLFAVDIDTPTIYGGDTYLSMFDYLRNIVSTASTARESTNQTIVYFPVETSINLRFRLDKSYSKIYINNNASLLQNKAGKYEIWGLTLDQDKDLYTYNSVYSQENTTIKYYPKNDNIDYTNKKFDTRIIVSEKKINGELFDNWTKFKVDNFLDVDSTYGPIGNLLQHNDQLLFWQDKAFGNIAVNPRSLISDNNTGQLVLGTGTVLDRYDYISTTVGNKGSNKPVVGMNGLYWYDTLGKVFYSYSGQLNPISKLKGITSFLNTKESSGFSWIGVYDYKYNDVIFTLKSIVANSYTLGFNELTNTFTSFFSFIPDRYIQVYNKDYYTIKNVTSTSSIYIHNKGNYSTFYGTTYPSIIRFVVNDNFNYTKVFDNFKFNTKSSGVQYIDAIKDMYADTFNTYKVYNSKQNTSTNSIFVGQNAMKRENEIILPVGRNAVASAPTTNTDILYSYYLNTSRLFRERIRDKYIIVEMTYNNSNNYIFSVPYVSTIYRMSIR